MSVVKSSYASTSVGRTKSVQARTPKQALHLSNRLVVYSTVFTDPTTLMPEVDTSHWEKLTTAGCLKSNESPGSLQALVRSSTLWSFLGLAALSLGAIWAPHRARSVERDLSMPPSTPLRHQGETIRTCELVTGALGYYEITRLKDAVLGTQAHIFERDTLACNSSWVTRRAWKLMWFLAIVVGVYGSDVTVLVNFSTPVAPCVAYCL